MKETITRYYCDRCGAEYRPYGLVHERDYRYGIVAFREQYTEESVTTFKDISNWEHNAAGSQGVMALCPKCLDSLTAYLRNEQ